MKYKKAQEEMVGFGIIIVVVAVLILVFLSISLNKPKEIQSSSKVEAFLQSFLQYTTDCAKRFETDYQDIQDVIGMCSSNQLCYNEKSSCEVLDSTINTILDEIWKVGGDYFEKGYLMNITSKGEELYSIAKGNQTSSKRQGVQILPSDKEVLFTVYS